MKMRRSQVVVAVVAIVAIMVIQIPTAQCAGWSEVTKTVRLSCDVRDTDVVKNLWGEWLSFKAGISAEGGGPVASWSWECKRAGLSTTYLCGPSVTAIFIQSGAGDGPTVPLMIVDVKISPGDSCAGCTACRQLLGSVTVK